jgi:hypothetical protein
MEKLNERLQACEAALATLAERIYAQLPAYLTVMQSLVRQVATRIEKANDA